LRWAATSLRSKSGSAPSAIIWAVRARSASSFSRPAACTAESRAAVSSATLALPAADS